MISGFGLRSTFETVGLFRLWNRLNPIELKFSSAKVNVPVPPKRPLTAYMMFCKENRKNVVKDNPSLTISGQVKVLAEKWMNLSQTLKKVYEDSARESIITYVHAHKAFYENLTETQKELLLKMKADKRESRKLFRLKKALKGSGIPKSPTSAYGIFLQMKAKEKKSIVSLSEFSKETANTWRNMSDIQKQPYIEKAKAEKKNYELQMKNWREDMINSEQKDLLKAYDESKIKGKKTATEAVELKHVTKKQTK